MTSFDFDDRIQSRADYDRLRQSFRWDCPEHFNFGFDVVDRWAETAPDHLAIHWVCGQEERWVTFSEVADRSGRLARALTDLGLARGDRVLVILPRIVPWWETLVGLFKAGLVAIPGTTLLDLQGRRLPDRSRAGVGRHHRSRRGRKSRRDRAIGAAPAAPRACRR